MDATRTDAVPLVPKYEGELIDIELDGRRVRFAVSGLYLKVMGPDRIVSGRLEIRSVESLPGP